MTPSNASWQARGSACRGLTEPPQNPETIADELNRLGLIGVDHFRLVFRIVVNQVQRPAVHALHALYPDAVGQTHHIHAVNIARPTIIDPAINGDVKT